MSLQPANQNIRKLCSDPLFISMMYNVVKYCIKVSRLPPNTTTVIGGAACMLYAYTIHERNMNTMKQTLLKENVPLTSDIDIAVWYDNIIDHFIETNKRLEESLREICKSEQLIQNLQGRITKHFGEIRSCRLYVLPAKPFKNMTSTIKIHIVINDEDFSVVDIAIKNPIYSQPLINERQRITKHVSENATYTNKRNTMLLLIHSKNESDPTDKDEIVRVPTYRKFIEQQVLADSQTIDPAPEKHYKYNFRIMYLLKYARPYAEEPHAEEPHAEGGRRTKKNKRSKRSKTRRRH